MSESSLAAMSSNLAGASRLPEQIPGQEQAILSQVKDRFLALHSRAVALPRAPLHIPTKDPVLLARKRDLGEKVEYELSLAQVVNSPHGDGRTTPVTHQYSMQLRLPKRAEDADKPPYADAIRIDPGDGTIIEAPDTNQSPPEPFDIVFNATASGPPELSHDFRGEGSLESNISRLTATYDGKGVVLGDTSHGIETIVQTIDAVVQHRQGDAAAAA